MNNKYTLPEFFISVVAVLLLLITNTDARALASMGLNKYMAEYKNAQKHKTDRFNKKTSKSDLEEALGYYEMNDNFLEFLKHADIYSKAESGKKMVLYINFDNPNDLEQAQNIKNIEAYKNSPDWTQNYTFVEYKMAASGEFRGPKNIREGFSEFTRNCQVFCVIDFDNGTYFKGTKKGDSKYLYKVLAMFYR